MNWKHKRSQGCVLVFLQSITAPTISRCQLQYKVPNGYLNLPLSSHSQTFPVNPAPFLHVWVFSSRGARLSAFRIRIWLRETMSFHQNYDWYNYNLTSFRLWRAPNNTGTRRISINETFRRESTAALEIEAKLCNRKLHNDAKQIRSKE